MMFGKNKNSRLKSFKKYLIKAGEHYEILLQNAVDEFRKNDSELALMLLEEILEMLESKREVGPYSICLKIELQIITRKLLCEQDLCYIKNLDYERARRLFGLLKFHQDAESYWITNMDEVRQEVFRLFYSGDAGNERMK